MSLAGIGFISNGAFCFAEPMRKSVDKIKTMIMIFQYTVKYKRTILRNKFLV